MKTILLQELDIHNFMGIRDLKFSPMGKNATIAGKNKLGKTSVASAFSYSLFGKDVYGNSENQFSLKTKDEKDQIIPMIDHIVENTLSIDSKPLALKRNYRETRTKKNRKLTGHTTDFWIDNEPDIKKKDFEAKIAEIISFDLFKMLTSVTAFADLPWKTLREQLFQICGDVKEDALGRAEKAKKIVASKKEEIEKKKKLIPARIDEKNRDLAAIADYDRTEIQARITDLSRQIQTIESDSSRFALLKEQGELEARLSQIRADQAKKKEEAADKVRILKLIKVGQSDNANLIVRQVGHDIEFQKGIIEAADEEINRLYSDWDKLNEAQPEIEDICPTCKQPLPSDQIEAARAEFNLQLSKGKEAINILGKKARAKKEKAVTEKIELEVDLKQKQIELAKIEEALNNKNAELENIFSPPETSKKDAEKEKNQKRIAEIKESLAQQNQDQDTETLEADLATERAKIAKIGAGEQAKARIRELLQEEKDMAAAIEKLEADLFYSEQKLEKEAQLVETAVNKKFEVIQFQLFKEHINTGVDPCCKILINGNEYGHGTSTSEEIRGGADFIRIVSEFYGVSCPLFLDRVESLTDPLPKMNCQIIRLVVDKNNEELEITYE